MHKRSACAASVYLTAWPPALSGKSARGLGALQKITEDCRDIGRNKKVCRIFSLRAFPCNP